MSQPPPAYWPAYPGGPPPPGYPGGPPPHPHPGGYPGSQTASGPENPEEKKAAAKGNDKQEDGASPDKDSLSDTNGPNAKTPAASTAKSEEEQGANSGPIPKQHMAHPMHHMPPGYPHMGPPPPYPGYHAYYPPPPHHYWGPPPQVMPPPPPGMQRSSDRFQSDVDGREGATSPSQIRASHLDEVQHMGCTCKKTRCLKLYCQCFGVKLYCGSNCRCTNCYNTSEHEKFRQEAIRLILSRNPSAFDTKFKKGPGHEEKTEVKTLAHKVGCKCRKSGCMKKYCECYAANVKCSANCRCMGCKNMGNTYYESSGPPQMKPYPEIPVYPVPHLHPGQVMQSAARAAAATRKTDQHQPPIQAAQNLAFLKHASPERPGSEKDKPDESVNSLMIAAYAMTEFGQGSSPSNTKKRETESSSNEKESGDGDNTKKAKV